MFSDAVDDGVLLANPALHLGRRQRRRPDKLSAADRVRNIRPMTQAELGTFLAAAQEATPLYAPLFLVLAHAGLRPVRRMRSSGRTWISRTVASGSRGPGRPVAWRHPRPGGCRTVDTSEHVFRTLRRLRAKRSEQRLKNRSDDTPPWVFHTEAGTPLDESRVRKNFAAALKKAELGGFRVYDLRHTFASLLLVQGAPITYVAAQLGHSKPTTTLQWYAHWIASSQERFVDGLAGPKTPKTKPPSREARAPIGHQKHIGRSGCNRSARNDWWAVKDSNLGPAD
jgi:integrase